MTRSSHRTRFSVNRLINEVYTRPEKDFHRKQKDEYLYDVSVVEIDARSKWIKVHYLSWDAKFDEWKNCKDGDFPLVKYQRLKLPTPETVHLRSEMFCQTLSRDIKRQLRLGWKDDLLSTRLQSRKYTRNLYRTTLSLVSFESTQIVLLFSGAG